MKAGRFLHLLFCFLVCFVAQSALGDDISTTWATLPKNDAFPGVKVEKTPFATPWPETINLGKTGFFIIGTSSFGQPEVFELTASGEATFIFQDTASSSPPMWKKVTFKVSEVAFDVLLSSLKAKVNTLDKNYDTDVNDGAQAFLSISDGTQIRNVWMNNFFPDEFRKAIHDTSLLINSEHFTVADAQPSSVTEARALYYKAFPKPATVPH